LAQGVFAVGALKSGKLSGFSGHANACLGQCLEAEQRGSDNRSSDQHMSNPLPLKNKLVTLLGGSGYLGNYVAEALLERGARLRIVSRNPERAKALQPLANLGQLQIGRCDITNSDSLKAAIWGSDAVINLVGVFDGDLDAIMGEAAGKAAQLASETGASAFVHVSAIGADESSPSQYGSAKGLGERLVLEAFPNVTIMRPSVVFGSDDNFINMFAGLIASAPMMPVFGPSSEMQPVHAGDVAEAIVRALCDPATHGGVTYELGGPEVMTMMEINQRIAAAQGRSPKLLAMPDGLSALFAALPLTPMSRDQWAMLKEGNCVSGNHPGLDALGIAPKPLGLYLDKWMVQYRKSGRFGTASMNT
jgi:NADH dehydrogenase